MAGCLKKGNCANEQYVGYLNKFVWTFVILIAGVSLFSILGDYINVSMRRRVGCADGLTESMSCLRSILRLIVTAAAAHICNAAFSPRKRTPCIDCSCSLARKRTAGSIDVCITSVVCVSHMSAHSSRLKSVTISINDALLIYVRYVFVSYFVSELSYHRNHRHVLFLLRFFSEALLDGLTCALFGNTSDYLAYPVFFCIARLCFAFNNVMNPPGQTYIMSADRYFFSHLPVHSLARSFLAFSPFGTIDLLFCC